MMTIGFLFWLLMIFWLVLGFVAHRTPPPAGSPWGAYYPVGMHLLIFVLFFLVGWKVFGWPIAG